jgi:hypothetical protein
MLSGIGIGMNFRLGGSIQYRGMAKLKNDPGLCRLGEIALKGFLAEKDNTSTKSSDILHGIERGKIVSQQIANYADSLISTFNPIPPESKLWAKLQTHPHSKKHKHIKDHKSDHVDRLNTVQEHTKCSPKYCLKEMNGSKELSYRFNYPLECCEKTMIDFEPIHTKDKSIRYRLKVKTKRNYSRLNNHQPVQLEGWHANCDIQVIIDHHACVEYLSKYAANAPIICFHHPWEGGHPWGI